VTVGGRPVMMPSVTAEEHQKLIDNVGLYDDPELAAYVNEIGQRIVANSSMPDQPFTFTLLDSPDINAFALPGGFIYVNRGLLAYLDSEAELAGVLAHEVGHITENHHGRRRTQQVTSQVTAVAAAILTGSGEVYDAASMYGAELISGFGRDMELEADSAGAEFMHRAGYDADAMLSVIGVLKDQEQYRRVQAKASGKPSGTYHGLYSSHPRNDLRLQTVIRAANSLPLEEQSEDPEKPGEYRRQTDGLVFGASATAQGDPNRFYHNNLDFTFAHPPGWTVQQGSREIIARSPDGSAELTISLARIEADTSPADDLNANVSGTLSAEQTLEQSGVAGHTAIASAGGVAKRVAVIDHRYRFRFEGTGNDVALMEIIQSFRPLAAKEKVRGDSRNIQYVQVPRGATIKSLSTSARVSNAEDQLRLINGYYPAGEPRIGDWIKVIR
jgi:predicted Zn-dependent protease